MTKSALVSSRQGTGDNLRVSWCFSLQRAAGKIWTCRCCGVPTATLNACTLTLIDYQHGSFVTLYKDIVSFIHSPIHFSFIHSVVV